MYLPTSGSQRVSHISSLVPMASCRNNLKPKLVVNSGDTVDVEMVTHHAGDYYEGMIKGDPDIEGESSVEHL